MTKQIERMLLSNNQEFHGAIKTMYSQWYRARIYDMIICAILLITLIIVTDLLFKRLYKEYKSLDPNDWKHPDSFTEFMYDDHFPLMLLLIFLVIIIIAIIITAVFLFVILPLIFCLVD